MKLHELIAEKVVREPRTLDYALATLDKWEALGEIQSARIMQWRRILMAAKNGRHGMKALIGILRGSSARACRMREFAPFAGVLTREERRKVLLECVYSH